MIIIIICKVKTAFLGDVLNRNKWYATETLFGITFQAIAETFVLTSSLNLCG